MTYKEALAQIDNYGLRDAESPNELRKAAEMFYKAIEKQIPSKPKDFKNIGKEIKIGLCSCCGDGVNYMMMFCSNCGQALDWSDEE